MELEELAEGAGEEWLAVPDDGCPDDEPGWVDAYEF